MSSIFVYTLTFLSSQVLMTRICVYFSICVSWTKWPKECLVYLYTTPTHVLQDVHFVFNICLEYRTCYSLLKTSFCTQCEQVLKAWIHFTLYPDVKHWLNKPLIHKHHSYIFSLLQVIMYIDLPIRVIFHYTIIFFG